MNHSSGEKAARTQLGHVRSMVGLQEGRVLPCGTRDRPYLGRVVIDLAEAGRDGCTRLVGGILEID